MRDKFTAKTKRAAETDTNLSRLHCCAQIEHHALSIVIALPQYLLRPRSSVRRLKLPQFRKFRLRWLRIEQNPSPVHRTAWRRRFAPLLHQKEEKLLRVMRQFRTFL